MTKVSKKTTSWLPCPVTICFNWEWTTSPSSILHHLILIKTLVNSGLVAAPHHVQKPSELPPNHTAGNSSYFFLLRNSYPVCRGKHRQSLCLRLYVGCLSVGLGTFIRLCPWNAVCCDVAHIIMINDCGAIKWRGVVSSCSGIPLNYSGKSGVP